MGLFFCLCLAIRLRIILVMEIKEVVYCRFKLLFVVKCLYFCVLYCYVYNWEVCKLGKIMSCNFFDFEEGICNEIGMGK